MVENGTNVLNLTETVGGPNKRKHLNDLKFCSNGHFNTPPFHSGECKSEHHKLIIDIHSGIERDAHEDALGADEIVIRLWHRHVSQQVDDKAGRDCTHCSEQKVVVWEVRISAWSKCEGLPLRIDERLVIRIAYSKNVS